MRGIIIRILCALACLMLAFAGAAFAGTAETVISVESRGLELGESSVEYPVITGMEDEELQDAVNIRILEDTKITERLTRMSQLISEGYIRVAWTGGIAGDGIFSCAVSAEGALETARNTHEWTWSNIDLKDGHEITMDELFTDPAAAAAAMESYMEEKVAPELSAHLLNSELTPLPEGFRLTGTGIILLYPAERLCTLGDRAGAVRIGWNELRDTLDLEDGSILSRMGVREMTETGEHTAEALEKMTAEGALPDIPAVLGESLKEKTDEYGMLTDPDVYEDGRMFALDGAEFRSVFLLTDFLSEEWDSSVIQGIRADEGCFWGLCIGTTERREWQMLLGEPDSEIEFDEDRAEAYRTVPGICDYYTFGSRQLRLYSGRDGRLISVILTE